MKKWEDILKDRLEGYESTLPEGSLSGFRAMRDAAASPRGKKLYPLAFALAAAAGLAAVLFFPRPEAQEDGSTIIRHTQTPVAAVQDSMEVSGAEDNPQVNQLVAQTVNIGKNRQAPSAVRTTVKVSPSSSGKIEEAVAAVQEAVIEEPVETVTAEPAEAASEEPAEMVPGEAAEAVQEAPDASAQAAVTDNQSVAPEEPGISASGPYASRTRNAGPVLLKVAPPAGAITGTGLITALAISAYAAPEQKVLPDNPGEMYGGTSGDKGDKGDGPIGTDPSEGTQLPEPREQVISSSHAFPLNTGISFRIPVWEKLSVTTGLEYSIYSSTFKYTGLGSKKQLAHYLGVPLRLDWTLADGRFVDVYLGAGVLGEICLGATLAGEPIRKDGPVLSLMGEAGLQLNITKRLGIFVEPRISWKVPYGSNTLQTYRSNNPLVFSAASGIRIELGK